MDKESNLIRSLRYSRDWSMQDLAMHAHLSITTVLMAEKHHRCSKRSLRSIAQALGTDYNDLLREVDTDGVRRGKLASWSKKKSQA